MTVALPTGNACQTWWAPLADPDDPLLTGLLCPQERRRHARFTDPQGRAAYLTARALTRQILGAMLGLHPQELSFAATCRGCRGPHGKPRLSRPDQPVRFSLSHSARWCVLAVTRHTEVGVDVEKVAVRGGKLPLRALAESERLVMQGLPPEDRTRAFVRYWTRKEALLKATGDGLAVDPATVVVSAPSERAALLHWATAPTPPVCLADLGAPDGYEAALASVGTALVVSTHDASSLIKKRRAP